MTSTHARPGEDFGTAADKVAFDRRALRSVAFDVLGRPPFEFEVDSWRALEWPAVVDDLLARTEAWQNWVDEQLYYFLLVNNFAPRTDSIRVLAEELAGGTTDVRTAIHRIALTPTFDARNPGADTFVTVVMEQLTGIDVKRSARDLELGKRLYDGVEASFLGGTGRSQADVVRLAVENRLFVRHLLSREYQRLVRQSPEAKSLTAWAQSLERSLGSYRDLLREWLLSEAYRARLARRWPLENRAFVRALFVDLVARVPTAKEAEPMREALDALSDSTPLRNFLARTIVESAQVTVPSRSEVADPAAWVREHFSRFLARAPTDAELATFVEAFADPACRPRTIVAALVTSREYQSC